MTLASDGTDTALPWKRDSPQLNNWISSCQLAKQKAQTNNKKKERMARQKVCSRFPPDDEETRKMCRDCQLGGVARFDVTFSPWRYNRQYFYDTLFCRPCHDCQNSCPVDCRTIKRLDVSIVVSSSSRISFRLSNETRTSVDAWPLLRSPSASVLSRPRNSHLVALVVWFRLPFQSFSSEPDVFGQTQIAKSPSCYCFLVLAAGSKDIWRLENHIQ